MENSPSSAEKVAELVAKLQARFGVNGAGEREDDEEPVRYVIYVRRSLEESSQNQQRSIGDQILECKGMANRLGLRWVDLIHEEKSAKVSDKREKFRAMLDAIKAGKYDGIITWAPDRLARNMKEGGEIIDLLDHGIIRDIKFSNNYTFNNDASGKMLLGIAFIMAKQFSDTHSASVSRGIKNKTREGKWAGNRTKYGYWKDKAHYLRPDGKNHELVSEVFKMRLAKKPLSEIALFLRGHGFPVATEHIKQRKLVIDEKFVSDLLRDPLYAGAMIYGNNIVNLFDKYNFVPCVSAEDFERICKLDGVKKGYKLTEVIKPRGSINADLMRGMVICGHCKAAFATGETSKYDKAGKFVRKYFYYRCDTVGCKAKGKSTRAKVVLEAAFDFLNHHPLMTEKGYKHYVEQMEQRLVEQEKETIKEIKSLQAQKQHAELRAADMKEMAREAKDDRVLVKEYQTDMKANLAKAKELEVKIQKLKARSLNAKDAIISFAEFHELFKNITELIQKIDSMADLDFIMRKIFMNFIVTDQKVTEITQNSPFRELCLDADSAMVTPRRIELRLEA